LKKRRHKLTAQKKRATQREAVVAEEIKIGAHGPADPMPDGRIRQGQEDVFMRLKRLGQLTADMEWAVDEILIVYRSRTSALWARVADMQRVAGQASTQDSAWLIDAGRRYDKWADWAKRDALKTGINTHSLILDIFNDSLTLGACDAVLRRRKGTSKAVIERGLNMYATLAGRLVA
jgi:hypothetical protein